MLKVITVAAIAGLALAATITPQPALAGDGGAVAAGVVGGLAVGAIIGSQVNRGSYYGPDPGYQPVYNSCHVERVQVVDEYGRYHVRRIRVCD
jgi:hypothetical protein